MIQKIKIFNTTNELNESLANLLSNLALNTPVNIAISGGKSPISFFNILATVQWRKKINWKNINIFWCDERCVPSDHAESNYGMAKKKFLNIIPIPQKNIHPIIGDHPPIEEAERYSAEIKKHIPLGNNTLPVFDLIILGIGTDGHTASIFPNTIETYKKNLNNLQNIYIVTQNPINMQNRISINLPVINSAKRVVFIVAGEEKKFIISEVIKLNSEKYPASMVQPKNGKLEWFIHKNATS